MTRGPRGATADTHMRHRAESVLIRHMIRHEAKTKRPQESPRAVHTRTDRALAFVAPPVSCFPGDDTPWSMRADASFPDPRAPCPARRTATWKVSSKD